MLFGIFLAPALAPAPALAYQFSTPPIVDVSGDVCPGTGLARRLMPCIRDNILSATDSFLVPFSTFLADAVGAACTLAIAVWGIMMMSGRMEASKEALMLAVKVACVTVFSFNLGGLFPALLDGLDEMLGVVGSYVFTTSSLLSSPDCPQLTEASAALQVWDGVDCAIDTLVGGIYSPFSLATGLAGFLFASLFSNTIGFFIAIIGFYLVVQFLFIVARALYIFIAAYIGFALMVIISPIFIPMLLFTPTKGYFEKWLRLTGGFLLQPIILFAYLTMMVAAYDAVVFTAPYSIAHTLAGADANLPGFSIGGWVDSVGGYAEEEHGGKAIVIDPRGEMNTLGMPQDADMGMIGTVGEIVGVTAQQFQNNIFDTFGIGDGGLGDLHAVQGDFPTAAVNWDFLAAANGQTTSNYTMWVMISFALAGITAYILMTLLEMLPFISASMLGEGPGLGLQQLKPPGANLMNTFQDKLAKSFTGGGGGGKSSFL